jgi:hypothetical protein
MKTESAARDEQETKGFDAGAKFYKINNNNGFDFPPESKLCGSKRLPHLLVSFGHDPLNCFHARCGELSWVNSSNNYEQ